MKVSIRSKNEAVRNDLREYAEKRAHKLDRVFHEVVAAEFVTSTERGSHIVELTVEGDGVFLRSEERCTDLHAAIDGVVDKLERRARRYRAKRIHDHHRPGNVKEIAANHAESVDAEDEEEPFSPSIVRRKRFPMKPMPIEEAARQMELVNHTFFLFHNEETGTVNVLYRRRDSSYGLIEPEV